MKNPREFHNELEDLVLNHSEKHQVTAVLLSSHLFSAYMQAIHLLQQTEPTAQITAENLFDILAPDSRPDAAITVTRERLQEAIEKC